jgi:hypothetical protein
MSGECFYRAFLHGAVAQIRIRDDLGSGCRESVFYRAFLHGAVARIRIRDDLGSGCRESVFIVLFCTVLWHGFGSGIVLVLESACEFFNVLFCTDAATGGGGIADGRLSASAMTFLGPGTCRKSVVNSEMYANWRTCCADQGADT